MDLSRILCSSVEQKEYEVGTPEDIQQPSTLSFVRDTERKKPYRMSATQRQRRHEFQAYESSVYNLTLDINELRQQIRCLMERRDFYATRLLLNHDHFANYMVEMVWKLLSSYRSDTFGLTPSGRGVYCPTDDSSGGVHQFVMKRGRPAFTHRSFVVKSVRVLAIVDDESTTSVEAAHIRHVCGPGGGCVVEVLASFTGRIIRETFATMFPFIRNDEVLASQLIGSTISFSSRVLLYFDSQRTLARQIMQANIVAGLNALHISGSGDFAELAELNEDHQR